MYLQYACHQKKNPDIIFTCQQKFLIMHFVLRMCEHAYKPTITTGYSSFSDYLLTYDYTWLQLILKLLVIT